MVTGAACAALEGLTGRTHVALHHEEDIIKYHLWSAIRAVPHEMKKERQRNRLHVGLRALKYTKLYLVIIIINLICELSCVLQ